MEQELYHYGVLGMKWGIRRYQNADGSLTSEGRKRARQEYKEDNKKAFEYGKNATITARAVSIAAKKETKAANRWEKANDRNAQKRYEKYKLAESVREYLQKQSQDWDAKVKEHRDQLIEKYGKEAISEISRDKKGRANESVHTTGDYALSTFMSVAGTVGLALVGSPLLMVTYPKSPNQMGHDLYKMAKQSEKERYRKAGKRPGEMD